MTVSNVTCVFQGKLAAMNLFHSACGADMTYTLSVTNH